MLAQQGQAKGQLSSGNPLLFGGSPQNDQLQHWDLILPLVGGKTCQTTLYIYIYVYSVSSSGSRFPVLFGGFPARVGVSESQRFTFPASKTGRSPQQAQTQMVSSRFRRLVAKVTRRCAGAGGFPHGRAAAAAGSAGSPLQGRIGFPWP